MLTVVVNKDDYNVCVCVAVSIGLLLLSMCNATSESGHNVTSCYTTANNENYCFYTNGSVLSWDDARMFCARRNSTLPIINNENIDNAFQQFLMNDSYNMTQNNYVWIGAHAQTVQDDDQWYWINGQSSGFL